MPSEVPFPMSTTPPPPQNEIRHTIASDSFGGREDFENADSGRDKEKGFVGTKLTPIVENYQFTGLSTVLLKMTELRHIRTMFNFMMSARSDGRDGQGAGISAVVCRC